MRGTVHFAPLPNREPTPVMRKGDTGLVGREREQAELVQAIANVSRGHGSLVLLVGEAGVGKTRLAHETLNNSDLQIITGATEQAASQPYGPITAALRAYLRIVPNTLTDFGPLAAHLALLLPELGPPPLAGDRLTLFEAVRCALEVIASRQPTALFLDDLQWADNATLEFLPALAESLECEPLLLVGAYRSDEMPRGHPLRRMRAELRRTGHLHEIAVEPLDLDGSAALAARVLAGTPDSVLASILFDRTQGMPFFIEEIAAALASGRRLRYEAGHVSLSVVEDVPIPESVRDAVLLRVDALSDETRRALDVAAVVGSHFDLGLVADLLDGEEGLAEAVETGLLIEVEAGHAVFRHVLAREALYGDIPWTRRRTLHRQIAIRLEGLNTPPGLVAEHWFAAREHERARLALIASADAYRAIHAHRDALRMGRRALELWPSELDEPARLDLLDRLGECAELSGDLSEATRIWREVAETRRHAGDLVRAARVERRLATAYEIQCMWERAVTTRQAAAAAFAARSLPDEAATERLMVAAHLQGAGSLTAALELIDVAMKEAERAGRLDLQARALSLSGYVRAKLGQRKKGIEEAQAGLALALRENLTDAAAETYRQLAVTLECAADFAGARTIYLQAIDFCVANGVTGTGQICMGCLATVLMQNGDWERASEMCRGVLGNEEAPIPARMVAACVLGSVHALRGDTKRARRLLTEALAQAQRHEVAAVELLCLGGLARVDNLEGMEESAADRCRLLLRRWEQIEERHYAIEPLRWAATFFASKGAGAEMHECVQALARIAASTGNPEAVAALANGLGECALSEGHTEQAIQQFGQALDLLRDLDLPFERAHTQLRAGIALAAAGDRQAAVECFTDTYRTARKLGSRPLAVRAREELVQIGEQVDRRQRRGAASHVERGGLSRRELEVVRMVAAGRTNREIAQELFLSTRTVDMHVRNILTKLDCRSRADATRRATELGLMLRNQGHVASRGNHDHEVGEASGSVRRYSAHAD